VRPPVSPPLFFGVVSVHLSTSIKKYKEQRNFSLTNYPRPE
jgi:hypothetical protein